MFNASFHTNNAAFDGDPRREVARILRKIADSIECGNGHGGACFDLNGNMIGKFSLTLKKGT